MTGFNHYADCACGWCVNYGGRSRTNRPQLVENMHQRDAVSRVMYAGCYWVRHVGLEDLGPVEAMTN